MQIRIPDFTAHFLPIFLAALLLQLQLRPLLAQQSVIQGVEPYRVFKASHNIMSKPTCFPLATPLENHELHYLGELTTTERLSIEQEINPPAIGIARPLKNPIYFDLSQVEIPPQGEMSVFGGRLSRVSSQMLVWTTRIKSENASEIRLIIEEGYFPPGVEVNLFTECEQALNQWQLRGRVGEHGFFTTTMFADHVVLQVLIPIEAIAQGLFFRIPAIIHVEDHYLKGAILSTCYEDVSCDTAALFPLTGNLKQSTAWLMFYIPPNYYICSGGLLNDNREQDFQPFLLTAAHCFNSQAAATSLEARFDYHTTSCNGPVNTNVVLVNGSNLLTTGSASDFTLVLLHQQPEGDRYYLGWSAIALDDDEVLHSVHHPSGMPQQYSRHQNKYAPVNLCSGAPLTHYYYTRVQAGQLAGGSSGGLLVRTDGKVAGQLRSTCLGSGYNPCNYGTYYNTWGRFEVSYSDNNLQYWLAGGGADVKMAVSTTQLDFGEVAVGNNGLIMLNVSNSGIVPDNLNLEIAFDQITGSHANDFFVEPNAGLYLPPGSEGDIAVVFAPSSAGAKSAELVLSHNADNVINPLVVNLQATALPPQSFIYLENHIISSLDSECFAASQTITLAGNGSYFVVEIGGAAELVAGHNILFLEGSWVQNGAELNARISSDGNYCSNYKSVLNIESEFATDHTFTPSLKPGPMLRIFPNPTTGRFNLEFSELYTSKITVEIFGMMGERIFRQEISGYQLYKFDLSNKPRGVYFIRIIYDTEQEVQKLIKQ